MFMFFSFLGYAKNSLWLGHPAEIMQVVKRELALNKAFFILPIGASDSNYSCDCCLLAEVKRSFVSMFDPQSSKRASLDGETQKMDRQKDRKEMLVGQRWMDRKKKENEKEIFNN